MMFSQSILFCLWTNILSAQKDEKIVSVKGILQSLAPRNLRRQRNGSCKTTGGQAESCVFPFIFNGVKWNSCTVVDDVTGIPWCSTKTNARGEHISGRGFWGYCANDCPSNSDWGTNGGKKPNSQCVFPFIYADSVWNTCTTVNAQGGSAWCSTLTDNNNNHIQGNWGTCNSFTPTPALQCFECGNDKNANECQTGERGTLQRCDSDTSLCLVAKGLVKDRPEAIFKKCVTKIVAAAFHKTQKGSLVISDNSIITFCATDGCNTDNLATKSGMLLKFGDDQNIVDINTDCKDCVQARGISLSLAIGIGLPIAAIGTVAAVGVGAVALGAGAAVVGTGVVVGGLALAVVAKKAATHISHHVHHHHVSKPHGHGHGHGHGKPHGHGHGKPHGHGHGKPHGHGRPHGRKNR